MDNGNIQGQKDNIVGKKGIKKLVQEYGYDINDDEIQLVLKLNQMHSNK